MKTLLITLFGTLVSISSFSQTTCETFTVEGTDPAYDRMCEANWIVSYDLSICRGPGNDGRSFSWIWAFDSGTATDVETGETYQLHVSSGWNNNPGKSGREDGYTFHWAGAVAGRIVVQQVIHVNYDGRGIQHEVRKFHIKCL